MTAHFDAGDVSDSGLLNPAWAGTLVAAQTSDRSFLKHLLDVEAAWTDVLAEYGLSSAADAVAAHRAAEPDRYDLSALAEAAQGGGNPLIPALKQMRAQITQAGGSGPKAVHMGATSQDIIDTALMSLGGKVSTTIVGDVKSASRALVSLARTQRNTPMVARSLAQHSLPSTFGTRAAGWLAGLSQAGQRLEAASQQLPVQWGGAAGTMAALSGHVSRAHHNGTLDSATDSFTLVDALAQKLGLRAPAAPWHTNRVVVTQLGAALADVVVACGKIANDVLASARLENGELTEPTAPGRGGSSAMPHKQNPVLSVLVHSTALSAPGTLTQLYTGAGAANEERPDGGWHTEWPALRQLMRLAGGAARLTNELVSGIVVHEDRMLQNLNRTGPLLVSERIMAELAPILDEHLNFTGEVTTGHITTGKQWIQAVVDQSLADPDTDFATTLRTALDRDLGTQRSELVPEHFLEDLLTVSNYTGEAGHIVDRLTSEYEEWSQS